MCFSASASFTASAVLLLCGLAALKKAQKNQLMLATIPIIFSAQQFIEGVVWQTLGSGGTALLGTYGFLFFVFIVWPIWPSLSLRQLTNKSKEKKLLLMPLFAGFIVAALALYYSFQGAPDAVIMCNHIRYTPPLPKGLWLPGSILYLIATIAPFFLVKRPHLWMIGVLLGISYLVSIFFFFSALISIWCFFVALLSALVLMIVG